MPVTNIPVSVAKSCENGLPEGRGTTLTAEREGTTEVEGVGEMIVVGGTLGSADERSGWTGASDNPNPAPSTVASTRTARTT